MAVEKKIIYPSLCSFIQMSDYLCIEDWSWALWQITKYGYVCIMFGEGGIIAYVCYGQLSFFFFFGHAVQPTESQFPDQGSNPGPLQ